MPDSGTTLPVLLSPRSSALPYFHAHTPTCNRTSTTPAMMLAMRCPAMRCPRFFPVMRRCPMVWVSAIPFGPRRVKPFHQIRPTRVHVMRCAERDCDTTSTRDAPPLSAPPYRQVASVFALIVLPRLRLRAPPCAPRRQPHFGIRCTPSHVAPVRSRLAMDRGHAPSQCHPRFLCQVAFSRPLPRFSGCVPFGLPAAQHRVDRCALDSDGAQQPSVWCAFKWMAQRIYPSDGG